MQPAYRFPRPVLWLAASLLLLASLWFFWRQPGPQTVLDSPALVRQIQALNDLVTVRYVVQKVVGLEEQRQPIGSEKLLLVVQANVLAGVDLAQLRTDSVRMEEGGSVVRISLPEPKIVSVAIDEGKTKVWDRQVTWFTPWVSPNPDLERRARIQALQEVERTAIEMGILEQARRNAQQTLRGVLQPMGFKDVQFRTSS